MISTAGIVTAERSNNVNLCGFGSGGRLGKFYVSGSISSCADTALLPFLLLSFVSQLVRSPLRPTSFRSPTFSTPSVPSRSVRTTLSLSPRRATSSPGDRVASPFSATSSRPLRRSVASSPTCPTTSSRFSRRGSLVRSRRRSCWEWRRVGWRVRAGRKTQCGRGDTTTGISVSVPTSFLT